MPLAPSDSTPQTSGSSSTSLVLVPDRVGDRSMTSCAWPRSVVVGDLDVEQRARPVLDYVADAADLAVGHVPDGAVDARRRVVRRQTASTVPDVAPSRLTMSPMPNWSSTRMKMPDRKSRTSDCEPKPSATPMIPAPAISGPSSMPELAEDHHRGDGQTVKLEHAAQDARPAPRCAARSAGSSGRSPAARPAWRGGRRPGAPACRPCCRPRSVRLTARRTRRLTMTATITITRIETPLPIRYS